MNEQQLADLFSDQLDHLLQGQTPVLPPEASDLQELLNFGQQFSQITFQPSLAAQAVFQGQLTSWFGPTPGGAVTVLGISKTLLITLIAAATVAGIGLILLGVSSLDNSPETSPTDLPASAPQGTPLPTFNTDTQDSSKPEATDPEASATPAASPRAPKSSLEEIIPSGTSSLGDTVPSSPSSLGDTLSIPTPVPTATAQAEVGSDETVTGETGGAENDDGASAPGGDHDKGHGNDPDGIDEDNPGDSGDILGGDGHGQGQDNGSQGGKGNEKEKGGGRGKNGK